jgi:ribosomal-protein-alanine N-acetyltransferase
MQALGTVTRPLPKLTTGRVILRLPDPSEAPAVLAYFAAQKEHLANAGPAWPSDFLTEAYWQKQLVQNLEDFEQDRAVRFFLFDRTIPDTPTVIGSASLTNVVRGAAQYCNLGFSIALEKQGKSIMKEALQSVIAYGFSAWQLHRIMANYQPANERSGWLLRSLGFNVEGYARDYLFINGSWRDHILTSITNPNWVRQ